MSKHELSPELERRVSEDFRFLVLCQAKGNMEMYSLMRDATLDADLAAHRATVAKEEAERSMK